MSGSGRRVTATGSDQTNERNGSGTFERADLDRRGLDPDPFRTPNCPVPPGVGHNAPVRTAGVGERVWQAAAFVVGFVVCVSLVGCSVVGFSDVVTDSTLVNAVVTLALGIAGQSAIGSLVSGAAPVVDPAFNVGNHIRWADGEGDVTSITLRVTRVKTTDGALVTIPTTTSTDEAIGRPFDGDIYRMTQHVTIATGATSMRARRSGRSSRGSTTSAPIRAS